MTTADDRADAGIGRPTVDEIEQDEFRHPAVAVRVTDPVRVQELPARGAPCKTFVLATTDGVVKLVNEDPRRRKAVITCTGQAVYVGTDQEGVRGQAFAFRVPVGVLFDIPTGEQWWISSPDGDATVSLMSVQWAE